MTTRMHVQLNRHGVTRRAFLLNVGMGVAAFGVLGWKDAVTLAADELRKRGMACILLFMRGGPSQLETFDPKPGTDNGGPTRAIDTAVGGIRVAEHWPAVASQMKDVAIIRSVTDAEADHERAASRMRTGLGSIVASEIGPKDTDLPGFVSVGNPLRMPTDSDAAVTGHGPRLEAFDLHREKDDLRERYGWNPFGQGCLLARRLVESGVPFVEVESNGWDTHRDNFERVKNLAGEVDPAVGTLIADLKERGMLQRTLVVWAGEFGRTPRINPNTGRDHFPRAFNVLLAGGGIKGGQVVGKTSDDGMEVKERPVGVTDLFATICAAMKVDGKDGGPVKELF